MVNIKLFGILRLTSGFKEADIDITDTKGALLFLSEKTGLKLKDLKQCIITLNGKQIKKATKLKNGDKLVFMSPAGGG